VRKSVVVDNKKYMWDGVEYREEGEANAAAETYAAARFEIHRIVEKETVYLFTRRVVTEVKVEGAPS
jgi:hypothetical protein